MCSLVETELRALEDQGAVRPAAVAIAKSGADTSEEDSDDSADAARAVPMTTARLAEKSNRHVDTTKLARTGPPRKRLAMRPLLRIR